MHREILNKAAQCKPCTEIGKYIKSVIPATFTKWQPVQNCSEPNDEIQRNFGRTITSQKDQDIYFLVCIDRFFKYPTVEFFKKITDLM